MKDKERKSGLFGGVVTTLLSVAFVLVGLEAIVRLMDSEPFEPKNYISDKLSLLSSAYPSEYDPLLGYKPRAGYSGADNAWNTKVTIDQESLRSNGVPRAADRPVEIVAVGDSYTFGDEVSDSESWPALLEAELAISVANGGVFGYGLDQAILRGERLVEKFKPWALVVSFIYGDVRRTQLIQRTGVEKPVFRIVEGSLQLDNVPPSRNRPRIDQIGAVRTILGYSYLLDWSMRRGGGAGWWYSGGFPQVQVHSDGPVVACLLMRRLAQFQEKTGTKMLIVAQYLNRNFTLPDHPKSVEELSGSKDLLACAEKEGLATVDTFEALNARYLESPDTFSGRYFLQAHMSKAGNQIVAEQVADALIELTLQ